MHVWMRPSDSSPKSSMAMMLAWPIDEAERALARLELSQLERPSLLAAENRRLQAAVDRAGRDRNTTASRRLQAELDENARLRKALEDAQKKLDAIANIERTITERKPQPEGRTP